MTKVLNPPYSVSPPSTHNPCLLDRDGYAVASFESADLAAIVAAALNAMDNPPADHKPGLGAR